MYISLSMAKHNVFKCLYTRSAGVLIVQREGHGQKKNYKCKQFIIANYKLIL